MWNASAKSAYRVFYPLGIYKCRPDITKACSHSTTSAYERLREITTGGVQSLERLLQVTKKLLFSSKPAEFRFFHTLGQQQHTRVRYWSALFRNGRSLRVIVDISIIHQWWRGRKSETSVIHQRMPPLWWNVVRWWRHTWVSNPASPLISMVE